MKSLKPGTPLKKIGILSDTHGTFDTPLRDFLADVDEIWHAGDFGNPETADAIAAFKPLRGVYGNIDGGDMRRTYPLWQYIQCEGVRVMMTHIGGHPARYEPGVKELLRLRKPHLFISGHSHILRVGYDKRLGLLHINPGAAGRSGFHQVRTAIRLSIDGEKIENLEVGEWVRTGL